ncbi:MAG: hypothetical protein ACFB5Z_12565 [Elainellaceae cyanobacterium]
MDKANAINPENSAPQNLAPQNPAPQNPTLINDITEALTFVAEQGCPELAKDAGLVMRQYPEMVKRTAWAQLPVETRRLLQQLLRDERAA